MVSDLREIEGMDGNGMEEQGMDGMEWMDRTEESLVLNGRKMEWMDKE